MTRLAYAAVLALLLLLNAAGLWLVGWVAAPVIGAVWGLFPSRFHARGGTFSAAGTAAIAALLGWLLVLAVIDWTRDAWGTAVAVAGVMGIPAVGLYLLGPLLGALMAGSAAALTHAARALLHGRAGDDSAPALDAEGGDSGKNPRTAAPNP